MQSAHTETEKLQDNTFGLLDMQKAVREVAQNDRVHGVVEFNITCVNALSLSNEGDFIQDHPGRANTKAQETPSVITKQLVTSASYLQQPGQPAHLSRSISTQENHYIKIFLVKVPNEYKNPFLGRPS